MHDDIVVIDMERTMLEFVCICYDASSVFSAANVIKAVTDNFTQGYIRGLFDFKNE